MPTIDFLKYNVMNKHSKTVPEKSGPFYHGTEFYIEWINITACGYNQSTHRCDTRNWIGDLPACNPGKGL